MIIETLKLKLIQKISICDDPQILSTIAQLLEHSEKSVSIKQQQNNPLMDALLGQNPTSGTSISNSDLKDLQDSIDHVFLKK